MTPASTEWRERVAPDEAARFERLASDLHRLQGEVARRAGATRRALHAKANLVARARFEVSAEVPAPLRVGLFAEPKGYDAVARFSNGDPTLRRDARPDVRGLAVKLLGVGGRKLIPGLEDCATQDFLAILNPATPFRSADEFVWFVTRASRPLTLLPAALLHLGPARTLALVSALRKDLGAPLTALHTNRYFSALPIRLGPHAAKFCFTPLDAAPAPPADGDLGADLRRHLAAQPARWAFQVQLFQDEASTPIEDPTVEWRTPWTTLATLTLPQQPLDGAAGQALAAWAEGLSFDPWHAQEELRPLGELMRMRNVAYRVSTQARGAQPEPTALPAP